MNNEKKRKDNIKDDQACISQWTMYFQYLYCIYYYREQNQLAFQIQNENTCLQNDFDVSLFLLLFKQNNRIQLIGGLDISYLKDDINHACGCCVVYDILEKKVIYSDCIYEEITVPYIPGYLAYRELPIYRKLLQKIQDTEYWPSLFLVDGHGILHPRHCGSACMVGLEFDCPTIGVGKSQFCGDQFIKPNEQNIKCEGINVCSSIQDWKTVHEQYLKMNKSIVYHLYSL